MKRKIKLLTWWRLNGKKYIYYMMKNAITTTAHKKNKRKSNICTRHKEIARSHAKNNDNHLQSQRCVCVCVCACIWISWRNDAHSKVLYKRRFVYAQNYQFEFKKFRCTTDRFAFPLRTAKLHRYLFYGPFNSAYIWIASKQSLHLFVAKEKPNKLQLKYFFINLLTIS